MKLLPQINFLPIFISLYHQIISFNYRALFYDLIIIVIAFVALWLLLKVIFRLLSIRHQLKQKSVFLEITPPSNADPSTLSTAKLFTLISHLLEEGSFIDRLLLRHHSCSLEIVSSKGEGIRFLVRVPENISDSLEKSLRIYVPGIKIQKTSDYLLTDENIAKSAKVIEFKLSGHFSLPLHIEADNREHDPIAYLAGNMTQLKENEMLAFQIIIQPLHWSARQEIKRIKSLISSNKFSQSENNSSAFRTLKLSTRILEKIVWTAMIPLLFLADFVTGEDSISRDQIDDEFKPTPADKEASEQIKSKLNQQMFKATVRALLVMDSGSVSPRKRGLASSFSSFFHPLGQSIVSKKDFASNRLKDYRFWQFKNRLDGTPLVLTSSEVGALYHFPSKGGTEIEDLAKVRTRDLPAPLALKNNSDLDVMFGKSTYGNLSYDIGLTDDDRSRHVYLIGQTGSGKTTIIYHMAKDDINKGRGLAVVDPHGDLTEDLLNIIPEKRTSDLIYFNPFDIKHPVGLNLLELSEGLDDDELELEKELVCESVISIFRRVFFKDESIDAHRIEYILRNAIYTVFTLSEHTIFTVYDLLNDASFRKATIKSLKDENLLNFWKNEFGKAGDYQLVKMASGVTAKVGRFLFSPIAKRILEQPKSTINFDDILSKSKILICNLAEGKLGEDTSQLLGATVIAKIHQATVRRIRAEYSTRKPFYLFVDEFQNYATNSFTKLLSGGRKFGLRITIAEQSTAQQQNRNIVNVILANTGTVICFRTASPIDEDMLLAQFSPALSHGDIGNLPRFHFYMKVSASEPLEPLSGITIPVPAQKNQEKIKQLIEASRENYATKYTKPVKQKPVESKKEEQEEGIALT
jgi:GTPase SAR1 family protein